MMSTMPPDSHKISLKIIEAIKQHPVLYSTEVKGSSIKLQEFRQKVWKRIADELRLDPTWVRLRWKNLRDTYCRILKYKNKTDKGVRRKKWIFEDHLSFLKFPYESDYQPQCIELTEEYVQDINAGALSSEGLLEQLEDRNDEDYSEYLEVLEETSVDPLLGNSQTMEILSSTNRQLPNRTSKINNSEAEHQNVVSNDRNARSKHKKKRHKRTKVDNSYSVLKNPLKNNHVNTIDNNPLASPIFITNPSTTIPTPSISDLSNLKEGDGSIDQLYLAPEGKSSIELFFDSMAQTVKKLPPKAQADIKMNICKIVTEAEVRYSGQNIPQSTQQFIAPPGMIPKLVLIPCSMIDGQNNKG